MKDEMPNRYSPQEVEYDIYAKWMESGYFTPENLPDLEDRKESFTISLPPPNVTGTLHMGHAVMLAIEDAMVRYARMSGKRALWLPGTDHAAIATESKVEKILIKEEGKNRHDLGREKFLEKAKAFAQDSHDTIVNQMKKMGTSVDWTREAYTFDDARNLAVRTAFKKMYDDGLIYRGERIINWDPKGQTTISDDEVEYIDGKTPFYYFQYGPFVIGTARPETKFGDKYVVMHPDDKRYAQYEHGQKLDLEWINGPITATVIKDEAIDMEFGTGVMTITPWHSVVDFEIAERHNLDKEQIIDLNGKLLAVAGEFAGMHIMKARPEIVEKLKSKGLLVNVDEAYGNRIATAQRSGGIVEPQILKQWFIDVNKEFEYRQSKRAPIKGLDDGQKATLKQLMQHAVRQGGIEILPDRFNKTYFNWVDNLRDWNISRQIWFGHQIPVWYKGEEIYCGIDAPAGEGWVQDEDTLDTWFSAGLWTFSTLGWPNENSEDLKIYHPTSVLETDYDIIFFWVARMILMSTYILGEVPFKTVYLHGMVRNEDGSKMSKSSGKVIDPLEMIEKFGADATRLSLLVGATPGNDMKLSEDKISSFRNFTNKLWNISRFVFMSVKEVKNVKEVRSETLDDKWILAEFSTLVSEVTDHFEKYQYSMLGEKLREFTWNKFADVYLENAKVQSGQTTNEILLFILERLLILWHPFAPFVTEEIYKKFDSGMLMIQNWPKSPECKMTEAETRQFALKQSIIERVRLVRAEKNLPWREQININLYGAGDIQDQDAVLKQRLKLDEISWVAGEKPQIEIAEEKYDL